MFLISFILFSASAMLDLVSCQMIIVTTLFEDEYACPGKVITFTCTTNGSAVVTWISHEYIGTNGRQLELDSSHSVGDNVTSVINSGTFANLTKKKGNLVTESQLHINVSQDIPIANVICSDNHASSSPVQFELLCKYYAPVNYMPHLPQLGIRGAWWGI